MAKHNLPTKVHEHFRKANLLHTYVQKDLGEATKHALETGQELLAAKSAVPPKKWEGECERLFDGSLRTAQFYMQFSKDMGSIKSAARSALLMLEGTLDGAAKAARKAAIAAGGKKPPKRPTPPEDEPIDVEFEEPEGEDANSERTPQEPSSRPPRNGKDKPADYGKCPNCVGSKWDEDEDGVSCAKCHHPYGEPPDEPEEKEAPEHVWDPAVAKKAVKALGQLVRALDSLGVDWEKLTLQKVKDTLEK